MDEANDGRTRPIWGVAVSAAGGEGLAPSADWSRLTSDGRLPPSADGAGFGVDFATDLALMAERGIAALRWTLDWSRLEPRPGRWDADAADHVTEVLRAARRAGVEVWAVLHDGPAPGWFTDDARGFLDEDGLRRTWPRHVDRVAETFGDLVAGWVPILDPFRLARDGYRTGTRPPGRRDEGDFLEALGAVHRASLVAWRLLSSGAPPVACCIDTCPVEAGVTSREPDERDAARARARAADRLRVDVWVRALTEGLLAVPGLGEVELDGLAGAFDVVGLTYRGARTVFADGSDGPYPLDAPVAADGRAPWTEGLGVVLRRLSDELPGRRLAVLGTGVVDRADDWRAEVLAGSVLEVDRAAADGVRVERAFWESAIDGWTPECGLDVPDGLIDRARHPRPSLSALPTSPR